MSSPVFYDAAAELATLTVVWKDAAGTATNSTTTLTVTDPTGTQTTPTPSHGATGTYTKDISCTIPGEWIAVFVTADVLSDVEVVRWTVFDADVLLLCSVESVKSRMGSSVSTNDNEIRSACGAVADSIGEYCQDFFGRKTDTRTFECCDPYEVDCGSLVSITTLKTDSDGDGTFEQTWTSGTDYQLLPYNTSTGRQQKPYTKIRAVGSLTFPYAVGYSQRRDRVQIVGVFGWPAVPEAVREAALILTVELFKLKDAPFGVAGFDTFGAVRVKDNPKAMALLQPYRRYPVMVA